MTDCLKEGTGKREPQVGEPSDIPDDAASGKTKKRTGRSFNQKGIVAYKLIMLVVDKKVNYRGANEHWELQLGLWNLNEKLNSFSVTWVVRDRRVDSFRLCNSATASKHLILVGSWEVYFIHRVSWLLT